MLTITRETVINSTATCLPGYTVFNVTITNNVLSVGCVVAGSSNPISLHAFFTTSTPFSFGILNVSVCYGNFTNGSLTESTCNGTVSDPLGINITQQLVDSAYFDAGVLYSNTCMFDFTQGLLTNTTCGVPTSNSGGVSGNYTFINNITLETGVASVYSCDMNFISGKLIAGTC